MYFYSVNEHLDNKMCHLFLGTQTLNGFYAARLQGCLTTRMLHAFAQQDSRQQNAFLVHGVIQCHGSYRVLILHQVPEQRVALLAHVVQVDVSHGVARVLVLVDLRACRGIEHSRW